VTRRRKFLAGGVALGAASLSGCLGQLNQSITQFNAPRKKPSDWLVSVPSTGLVQARGEVSDPDIITGAEDPLAVGINSDENQMVIPANSGDQSVRDLHSDCALPSMFQTDAVDHVFLFPPVDLGMTGEIVDIHSVNEPFAQSAMTSLSYDRTRTVLDSLKESIDLGFSYPTTEDEIPRPPQSLMTQAGYIESMFLNGWYLDATLLEPDENATLTSAARVGYQEITVDLNQVLQDARREILDSILTTVGAQLGLPNAVVDPVFEEIINEAQQHLQFEYDVPEYTDTDTDSFQSKCPVRLSGEFDVQGQTVTFETPFVPILMESGYNEKRSTRPSLKWSLNTDLSDWISEAQRVLNIDF
jgi:hypothetical protein